MTYDPVKIIERPKVGIFSGLPSAAPGTALVVDREGHAVRVLEAPGDRLTAGEVRWGQIRTLYAVDITQHHLEYTDTFPCADDSSGFRAVIKLSCMVTDPADVVRRGIRDVARVIFPPVTETLRRVCGGFAAEASDLAEKAGLNRVREIEAETGHDSAFQISHIHLELTLDDAAAMFLRGRKEADRNVTRERDAARLDEERAKLEAELVRTRTSLEAEQAKQTAEHEKERFAMRQEQQRLEAQLEEQRSQLEAARALAQQQSSGALELERLKFEAVRQRQQAQLDAAKLELDIARAELEAKHQKLELEAKLERDQLQVVQYIRLLGQGEFARLALQLVENPAAIGAVNDHLAAQRDADINRQLHALGLLLENDGLEGFQITDQANSIHRQLIDNWSARSTALSPPGADAQAGIGAGDARAIESGDGAVESGSGGGLVLNDDFPADREDPEPSSA